MSDQQKAFDALRKFLGESVEGSDMSGAWSASPFELAWLIRPKAPGRGGHLFLVLDDTVQPVQLARTSLDEAYKRLLDRASQVSG